MTGHPACFKIAVGSQPTAGQADATLGLTRMRSADFRRAVSAIHLCRSPMTMEVV